MENLYNVWNKWDPLKTVVLGDTYRPEFYRNIKNKKIRDGLMQITDESLEDLENFENVLKQFGCKVLRPHIDPNDDIMYPMMVKFMDQCQGLHYNQGILNL